jgi:malate dehydrogenase (oxaloacetate-decarboxylating)
LYLGWKHPRLEGTDYWDFIERFVLGVKRNFPRALVQWEDFAKHKAFTLLERYRDRLLSFDDDIQGTGAVALAAITTAMRIKKSAFASQRFLIAGLGQAGVGIARNIRRQLETEGLSDCEIRQRVFAVDVSGLVCDDTRQLSTWQQPFAQPRSATSGWVLDTPGHIGLIDVVRNAKPTVIIGVTAQPRLFSEELLEIITRYEPEPVVLALSNPTASCECTPTQMARVTRGLGFLATGSPFAGVPGDHRVLVTSQCNNLYIFPGVGLGALVAKAAKVTDAMFLAASRTLSALVTPEQEAQGYLLPPMEDIRAISREVAKAVAIEARDSGLGRLVDDATYEKLIARAQWEPRYAPFRPAAELALHGWGSKVMV